MSVAAICGSPSALARLRSRRGLETHLRAGSLSDIGAVTDAIAQASNAITAALLLPCSPRAALPAGCLEPAIESRLRELSAGSPLHLTLVEAVRRRYKQDAMQADKDDKQAFRDRLLAEGEKSS